ncbi:MAG: hypothetical protein E6713_00025 [Sporomusaceae bacterium]|nr:hypothetical protein [Sporomusaceae bacterium]
MSHNVLMPAPPLDGPAVKKLEDALTVSPSKSILLEINKTLYLLSKEGHWFKFSLLTKKRTIKRATIFQTLTDLYNEAVHGQAWRIQKLSL